MSSLQKRVLVSKLPPRAPLGPSQRAGMGARGRRDYTPIHFSNYFTDRRFITIDKGETGKNVFCVYEIGTGTGPIIFMLHGGGFSGLTWALVSRALVQLANCRVYAMDIRGHGNTLTVDDADLSMITMASDTVDVIEEILKDFGEDAPDVILVGHSMGGALAVHTALGERPVPNLVGICVIDVVEGTALEALTSMQSFLRGRPAKFKTMEQAIEWAVRSAQVRNIESARVSMPSQLKNVQTGNCAVNDVHPQSDSEETNQSTAVAEKAVSIETISEDDETGDSESNPTERKLFKTPNLEEPTSSYTWRIDLANTEPFWRGWFEGLSSKFLSVPAAKLLLLAGVDRLDRDLTVGQMQGKFQMQILPQAGHAVHEDVPDRVAEVLAGFLVRNKFAVPLASFSPALPGC